MSDDQTPYPIEPDTGDNRPGYFARQKMKRQLKLQMKQQSSKPPMREKRKNKSSNGSVLAALSGLFTVFLVIAIITAASWLGVKQVFEVKNDKQEAALFQVKLGDNLTKVSERLEADNLISSQDFYRLLVAWEGNDTRLKAGEYKIPAHATMRDIMNIFVEGQSIQHKITLAEGLSTAMILEKIKKAPLLVGEITQKPAEGALMPETYLFQSGTKRDVIIQQMMEAQKSFITNLWDTRAKDLPLENIEQVVVLASIVEKETGLAKERPEVAAVFINRIKQKMKLQSDPTIIYGITKGAYKLGRSLKKSEIKAKTDYNTYVIKGLPPTPIANPGRASILAVLNPANVDYLYFVADGTGGHVFAKTYKQHQKNVKKWRKIEKNSKKK